MKTIRTTCSYCSVGCNFNATINDEGRVEKFMPAADYPVNLGKSCPKGFHLLKAFEADDRLTRPLLRTTAGKLEPVSWEKALDTFVTRFKKLRQEHGPESAAFISTGQIPMEEMAFLGALFKFGMGFVHADGNTRQCMATAAVAYKQSFGFDAPPFSYTDFEESDLMIFVGANPVISHPVMWNRVKMNRADARIVVVDPRRTKTAEKADLHLPVSPKGDLALLYGVAHELIRRGWIDKKFIADHTDDFDAFKDHVAGFSPEDAAARSGVSAEAIRDLAERIHRAKAVSIWWTMGVNQSHQAVRTAQAIINICLITGNIGRPGTGPNSITGQANAMGSRLFSNTTSLFAGYDFTKPEDRDTIAGLLGFDESVIPDQNSLPYHRILEEIDTGKIKALWIVATNPAHSWIDKNDLFRRLEKLEFLVVQDLYSTTETAQVADLVLPGAGSAEKNGTVINSERRIGIVDKLVDPPGEAKSDFEIFKSIADVWGLGGMFSGWNSPESVFRILTRVSRGRPCDISGIRGYDMLRERGGIQWPYPAENPSEEPERRLFADGRFFTDNGRARLLFEEDHPLPEVPDREYPLVLLTGRGTAVQFHTQTRTGKVEMLKKLYPAECYVEINPADARDRGVSEGDTVTVFSRRGTVEVDAVVTDTVKPGEIFMPMHYPETNLLTFPSFDKYSFEPAYKYAAVQVERIKSQGGEE